MNTTLEAGRTYHISHTENGFCVIGNFMLYTAEFDEELGSLVSEPYEISILKDGKVLSGSYGASASFDTPKDEADIQKVLADFLLSGYSQMSRYDENNLTYNKEFNNFLYNTVWKIK